MLSDFALSGCAWLHLGETCLVEDRKPCADILISEKPPRAVKLAALELQTCLAKITGATLPITTRPQASVACHIYVGKSEYTDALKISDEGLKFGAFRMISGKDYLALLGHDKDIAELSEYAAHSPGDEKRALKAWDEHTGEHWGSPYSTVGGDDWGGYSWPVGIWERDERGSLNAVYAFLYGLGVRF